MSRVCLWLSKSGWREVVVTGRDFILNACDSPRLRRTATFFTCWGGACLELQGGKENLKREYKLVLSKLQMEKKIPPTKWKSNILAPSLSEPSGKDTLFCCLFSLVGTWFQNLSNEASIITCGILIGTTSDLAYQILLLDSQISDIYVRYYRRL